MNTPKDKEMTFERWLEENNDIVVEHYKVKQRLEAAWNASQVYYKQRVREAIEKLEVNTKEDGPHYWKGYGDSLHDLKELLELW